MKEIKEKRGITLIALAITIVVLLILAAITISVVLSDNGIIGKAQEAANAMNNARSMYTEDNQNYGATSTMVYGRQWDSAMKYIEKTTDVKNSTNYGNYSDFNRNTAGISIAQNYNNINKYLADINRVSYNYPIEKAVVLGVDIISTIDNSSEENLIKTVPSYEETLNLKLNVKVGESSVKAYIRVGLGRKDNDDIINDITLEGNDLIKKGRYYYYTKVLDTDEELNFNLKIKNNVNCTLDDLKSEILIAVDALQAANVQPDFSKDNPWEGYEDEIVFDDSFFDGYAKNNNSLLKKVADLKMDEEFYLAYYTKRNEHHIDYTCLPNTKEETGYSDKWRINSIYDIAGNVSEYTMEKSNNSNVVRGGKFYQKGADDYMAKRQLVGEGNISDDIGYRAALYIKY